MAIGGLHSAGAGRFGCISFTNPSTRYAKRCRVAADGVCVGEGPGNKAITAVSSRKLRAGWAGNSHVGSACWEWKVFGLNLQGE